MIRTIRIPQSPMSAMAWAILSIYEEFVIAFCQKMCYNKLLDLCNLPTTKKAVLMVKNHLEVDVTVKCIKNGVVTVS